MSRLRKAIAIGLVASAFVANAPFNLFCGGALADPAPTIYPEFSKPGPREAISYSRLLEYVERGQVYRVLLQGNVITAELVDGRFVRSALEGDEGFLLGRLKFKGRRGERTVARHSD